MVFKRYLGAQAPLKETGPTEATILKFKNISVQNNYNKNFPKTHQDITTNPT